MAAGFTEAVRADMARLARRREARRRKRKETDPARIAELSQSGLTETAIAKKLRLGVPTVWVVLHYGSWAAYHRRNRPLERIEE